MNYCVHNVVLLKPGIKNYFQVPVINDTNHDYHKEELNHCTSKTYRQLHL